MGVWYNGNTTDFDSVDGGSTPPAPAKVNLSGNRATYERVRGLSPSSVFYWNVNKDVLADRLIANIFKGVINWI